MLLIGQSACEAPEPPPPALTEAFRCELLLIGEEVDECIGDFIGPAELTLTFRPDPKEASWEVALNGLAQLAEACEFRGRFDQTRLAALQGRGETEIVCPLTGDVDRQYHTLGFETRDATPNTALRIHVVLRRTAASARDG